MGNRPDHKKAEAGAASKIIMEEFGGPLGVAKHLRTNIETGINWND